MFILQLFFKPEKKNLQTECPPYAAWLLFYFAP